MVSPGGGYIISQIGKYASLNDPIETITGNSGGAVSPTGGNINVLGDETTITVVGDPGTSTLTISTTGAVATQFDTDAGTAIPALGILDVLGGSNINTAGATNQVTVNLDNTVTITGTFTTTGGNVNIGTTTPANPYDLSLDRTVAGLIGSSMQNQSASASAGVNMQMIVEPATADAFVFHGVNGGGQWSSGLDNSDSDSYKITTGTSPSAGTSVVHLTSAGVVNFPQYGTGILASSSAGVLSSITGTDGQVILGATGADPIFGSLTSADSSVVFATGTNTLDLTVDAAAAGAMIDLLPDSGTSPVVPDSGGSTTLAGGTNITTVGSLNTLTINLDDAITVATSVSTPLYTVASGDLVLNMTDDAGTNAVSFTNNSDAEVASVDSLGAAIFTELDVDNININGNTIISTDTDGDITLTPDGSGVVNISYLTQFTLPIAGASGAVNDLADGLGTSAQVLTSNGAGAEPTWQDAAAGGIAWNEVTMDTNMVVDNGYIANDTSAVTLTLPDTAAVGSVVRVAGKGSGGWDIAQNAGETIIWDESTSTSTGVGGSLASTDDYDSVELLCITADTDWVVISSKGNITVT